ncbi:MAG TPA: DNA-3-methyladenine glycosylase [Candidatus Krumholzibacteria bacterium]|nr:DNA-3-methyladenine glycosylase [Candidatus Krumholzibacteria bacterium]
MTRALDAAFFARPVLDVARDLVGAILEVDGPGGTRRARLVEVEAYGGQDDPASHAGRGPTPRSRLMFGPAGYAYVYLVYGMHHCLNVVTGPDGEASAVLIRAAEPLAGLADDPRLLAGPGRLCRALGIDLAWNGRPLAAGLPGPAGLRLVAGPLPDRIAASPRIGIRQAADRPWRFTDPASAAVSR